MLVWWCGRDQIVAGWGSSKTYTRVSFPTLLRSVSNQLTDDDVVRPIFTVKTNSFRNHTHDFSRCITWIFRVETHTNYVCPVARRPNGKRNPFRRNVPRPAETDGRTSGGKPTGKDALETLSYRPSDDWWTGREQTGVCRPPARARATRVYIFVYAYLYTFVRASS